MTIELTYTIPGRPQSWERTTPIGRGKAISTREYRAAKARVTAFALQARQFARVNHADSTGRWGVRVDAYYPDERHGDADRLCSLVMDAMERVIYASDRQVKDQRSTVQTDAECPRTEVRVWRMGT